MLRYAHGTAWVAAAVGISSDQLALSRQLSFPPTHPCMPSVPLHPCTLFLHSILELAQQAGRPPCM